MRRDEEIQVGVVSFRIHIFGANAKLHTLIAGVLRSTGLEAKTVAKVQRHAVLFVVGQLTATGP